MSQAGTSTIAIMDQFMDDISALPEDVVKNFINIGGTNNV